MSLNSYGEIADSSWKDIARHYPEVQKDIFVIMPNHVHGIIIINGIMVIQDLRRVSPRLTPTRRYPLVVGAGLRPDRQYVTQGLGRVDPPDSICFISRLHTPIHSSCGVPYEFSESARDTEEDMNRCGMPTAVGTSCRGKAVFGIFLQNKKPTLFTPHLHLSLKGREKKESLILAFSPSFDFGQDRQGRRN